jgi:hypothetical protein
MDTHLARTPAEIKSKEPTRALQRRANEGFRALAAVQRELSVAELRRSWQVNRAVEPKVLTGSWPSVRERLFAVLAERTAVRPLPFVLRLDFQSSGALVIVVVDVPLRRRLRKNRVVRIYSGH